MTGEGPGGFDFRSPFMVPSRSMKPAEHLSDLLLRLSKLSKMCHLVVEQFMDERKIGRSDIGVDRGPESKRQEKTLRRWLLLRYPMMTKELREDVCECAVQNYAFWRSDPRKYS